MAALGLIGMLIFGGFVASSYFALWRSLGQPLIEKWRRASGRERRHMVRSFTIVTSMPAILGALCIAAPFGPYTAGYVLGGVGIFIFVGLHTLVVGEIRRNRRSGHR